MAVVGAGRMGTALARALAARGYAVEALVARRESRARRAAESAGLKAAALGAERLAELPRTDLILITTPDDALHETAEKLAALSNGRAGRGRFALHTSGALSSEVLAPLCARGFSTGSLHPLVAVSDAEAGAAALAGGAFYCVEGDRAAVGLARRIVRELGGRSLSVGAEDKALYHAAAVMTAGHTVALFNSALGLLVRCGLTERLAREALVSLLRTTAENLSSRPPADALTGTFARADVETVRRHLASLRRLQGTDALDALIVYALLGERSLGLAERKGADPAALRKIKRALSEAFTRTGPKEE
ncbi:MAG TPA: Rossmann-like and DUF2520 domain-containing protein [Pyrinomonadaceae bacterium]|nr:Rossmann-like and DUF2520 domain-containing protein [Pyrinomonadaceae bacterium]